MEKAPQKTLEEALKGAPWTGVRVLKALIFFISQGFIYPKVMIEGMDLTRIQKETEGELYKKAAS